MVIYSIYKLIIKKAEQTCVAASDAGEITIDKAQALLDDVLKKVSRTNGKYKLGLKFFWGYRPSRYERIVPKN